MEDWPVSAQRHFEEVCENVDLALTQDDGDETKMHEYRLSSQTHERCCTCPLSHWRPGSETNPMTYLEVQNKIYNVEPLTRCDFKEATNTSSNFEPDGKSLSTYQASSLGQSTSEMNTAVTISLPPQTTKKGTPTGWKYLIIPPLEEDNTSPKSPTHDNISTTPATFPSAEEKLTPHSSTAFKSLRTQEDKSFTPTGWNYIIIPALTE